METIRTSGWCVYTHSIGGCVFYVGKGRSHRAFSVQGRNDRWKQIVDKVGSFQVTILEWFDTSREALIRERSEITAQKIKFPELCNVHFSPRSKNPWPYKNVVLPRRFYLEIKREARKQNVSMKSLLEAAWLCYKAHREGRLYEPEESRSV